MDGTRAKWPADDILALFCKCCVPNQFLELWPSGLHAAKHGRQWKYVYKCLFGIEWYRGCSPERCPSRCKPYRQIYWGFTYDAANPSDPSSVAYGTLTGILTPQKSSISYQYTPIADCGVYIEGEPVYVQRISQRTLTDAEGNKAPWEYNFNFPLTVPHILCKVSQLTHLVMIRSMDTRPIGARLFLLLLSTTQVLTRKTMYLGRRIPTIRP